MPHLTSHHHTSSHLVFTFISSLIIFLAITNAIVTNAYLVQPTEVIFESDVYVSGTLEANNIQSPSLQLKEPDLEQSVETWKTYKREWLTHGLDYFNYLNTYRPFSNLVDSTSLRCVAGENNPLFICMDTLVYMYDMNVFLWSVSGPPTPPTHHHGIFLAQNNLNEEILYRVGGSTTPGDETTNNYIMYGVRANNCTQEDLTFRSFLSTPSAYSNMSIATWNNYAFVYGGQRQDGTIADELWYIDAKTESLGAMLGNSGTPTAGSLLVPYNDFLYIFGGFNGTDYSTDSYKYGPLTNLGSATFQHLGSGLESSGCLTEFPVYGIRDKELIVFQLWRDTHHKRCHFQFESDNSWTSVSATTPALGTGVAGAQFGSGVIMMGEDIGTEVWVYFI